MFHLQNEKRLSDRHGACPIFGTGSVSVTKNVFNVMSMVGDWQLLADGILLGGSISYFHDFVGYSGSYAVSVMFEV